MLKNVTTDFVKRRKERKTVFVFQGDSKQTIEI